MFKNFAPINVNQAEVKLAVSLKREARKLAAQANEEMRNGLATQAFTFEATDKSEIRTFAEIAVWHYKCAAEKYRKSAERFEEAGKVQTGKSKAFNLMAKEMVSRAVEAEAAINLLNNFLKQN